MLFTCEPLALLAVCVLCKICMSRILIWLCTEPKLQTRRWISLVMYHSSWESYRKTFPRPVLAGPRFRTMEGAEMKDSWNKYSKIATGCTYHNSKRECPYHEQLQTQTKWSVYLRIATRMKNQRIPINCEAYHAEHWHRHVAVEEYWKHFTQIITQCPFLES